MESHPVVRRRSPDRKLLMLVSLVAAIAALPALAVATMTSVVPSNLSGPLRIASMSAPTTVQPNEPIPVRLTIVGEALSPMTVSLQYAAYFGVVASGSRAMSPVGGRNFETTIPSFPDGTEVWLVAGIMAGARDPVISQSWTIQVGTVPRGGASGLSITDVRHLQQDSGGQLGPQVPVTIEASITSRSPIAHVAVAYMAFCPERTSVPIDPAMTIAAPQRYSITITTPEPCTFAASAVLMYRVLAVDASGNTAVSDVYPVTMQGPRTPRAIP